jgi:hypothetical protein
VLLGKAMDAEAGPKATQSLTGSDPGEHEAGAKTGG